MDKLALERAFHIFTLKWQLFISSNRGYSRSPGYEVIYKSVWTFYFKYLNIKKNLFNINVSSVQTTAPFLKVCMSVLGATISQYHVPFNIIIFNITIQIRSRMWTILMECREKCRWAGRWRTEMRGVRSTDKRLQTGFKIHSSLVLINRAQRMDTPLHQKHL